MSPLQVCLLEELNPSSSLGSRWESLVKSNPASGFMQSLDWAAFKKKQGIPSIHLGIFDGDELVGGSIFYTSTKRNGAGVMVAPHGPVLAWEEPSKLTESLGLLIEAVRMQAEVLGVITMRIEPRLIPPVMPVLREFGRGPVDLVPRETLIVDLLQSEESLLSSMKPKGRYNIKVAQRSGVDVFEDHSDQCVERFYTVINEASDRNDFAVEPQKFFQYMADVLVPAGHARFLFVSHEKEMLGALLLITYGTKATYLYGGVTNEKRNLMGGYALQWRAMQIAKSLGCTTYDFYGFDPFRAPDNSYARFSQFKSQFGGTAVRFIGSQDYFFLDHLADAFVKVVNESKNSTLALSC